MVFAPVRDPGLFSHEAAAAPRRPDHADPPRQDAHRGSWRAVVHSGADGLVQTSWHLASCRSPFDPEAHCDAGRHGLETAGDPDGHCLADGACARCADSATTS
jgi:hypothetical protein